MSKVPTDSLPLLTVFTDASFCPNTHAAGWAVWAKRSDKPTLFHADRFAKPIASSLAAEAAAIGNACHLLMLQGYIGGNHHVLIKTDCIAVIEQIGRFAQKPSKLLDTFAVPIRQAAQRVRCLELRHVKAHRSSKAGARFAVNGRCDRAAGACMRAMREELTQGEK